MQIIKRTNEKGITLVALVITIVILIILATVSINAVVGDNGLIQSAKNSKDSAENAVAQETGKMNSLLTEYANIMAEDAEITEPGDGGGGNPGGDDSSTTIKVEEAIEKGESFLQNTIVKDGLGNEITIPGSFHLAKDSGNTVEEGIVIEDDDKNQLVWIPVGTYKTSNGEMTNLLTRRKFTSSSATEVSGDSVVDSNFYGEGDVSSVANKQIDAFKTSARSHKGFYIGRYEQGKGNVCIAGVDPITEITRDEAKSSAEARYRGHIYVTSELISSYAWDTTLNFICQTNEEGYTLATTSNSKYGNLLTGEMNKTGKYTADKYSNIYDFLGNYWEWTTEYCEYESDHCTSRGGTYFNGYLDSGFFAADRITLSLAYRNTGPSFRMQVYIK